MKGIVFTEFLDMVENVFSADMVAEIIAETKPRSGGAYLAKGHYHHREMVDMVVARKDLKDTIGRLLSLLMQRNTSAGRLKPVPAKDASLTPAPQASGRSVFTTPKFGATGTKAVAAAPAPANEPGVSVVKDKRNVRKSATS